MIRSHNALCAMACLFLFAAATHAQLPFRFIAPGDTADDLFGRTIAGAGDVNADGFDDFIVGAIGDDNGGSNAGSARVFSGANGSVLFTFYGTGANDQFGSSVAGAGDVNNDGYDDLIVGAFQDDDSAVDAGSATVFSGLDGSILFKIDGNAAQDNFGISVAGVGDLDGDSFDDFAIGAWLADAPGIDSGAARVFSGFDGSPIYTFLGDDAGDQMGTSLASAGDVNNDGTPDIIVGAILDDNGGGNSGMARIYSGSDGTILHTLNGTGGFDLFGISVDGIGDINADGFGDVIVGAMFDDNNGTDSGSATVFSGADGSVLFAVNGAAAGDQMGFSVAGPGDVNGDGVVDFAGGAPRASVNGFESGSVVFYDGNDGSIIRTFNGFFAGDQFGTSIGGMGDANGDGFKELVIGAPFQDSTGFNAGAIFAISIGGSRAYGGTGNPFFTLTLSWVKNANPPAHLGTLTCTGAAPGAIGISAVSLAPDDVLIFGGFPLLIAADAVNLQGTLSFGFDIFGQMSTPLSLKSPFTAGVVFHVQYFTTMPVPAASNGLELMIVR